jgi:hypothetical protein
MKRINIPSTFTGDTYNLDVSLVKVKVGRKVKSLEDPMGDGNPLGGFRRNKA